MKPILVLHLDTLKLPRFVLFDSAQLIWDIPAKCGQLPDRLDTTLVFGSLGSGSVELPSVELPSVQLMN